MFGFAHQAGGGRVEKDGYLVIGTEGGQAVLHGLELFAQGAAAQLDAFAQHQTAFFQLQFHLDAGVVLLLQVVAIGGKRVDPGLDTEQVRAQLGGVNSACHRSLPAACIGTQCQRLLWAWRQLSITARRSWPSL